MYTSAQSSIRIQASLPAGFAKSRTNCAVYQRTRSDGAVKSASHALSSVATLGQCSVFKHSRGVEARAIKSSGLHAAGRTGAARLAVRAGGDDEVVQLGTAKLPADVDPKRFMDSMFQWATTLTTSGQNMPFVLTQKVDRTPDGFQISFMKRSEGTEQFESVGDIVGSVEGIPGGGDAVVIKGYGAVSAGSLPDVPIIMNSMPGALKRAVDAARQ